jgi:hypothetical protein
MCSDTQCQRANWGEEHSRTQTSREVKRVARQTIATIQIQDIANIEDTEDVEEG